MKNLLLLFALSLTLFACEKVETQDSDLVEIIGPQDVYYNVHTRTDAKKRVVCKLYAVDEKTHSKGKLVSELDTFITAKGNIKFTLTQTVRPNFYCYASMEVYICDNQEDTIGLTISCENSANEYHHGYSCPTNYLDVPETFFQLYVKHND